MEFWEDISGFRGTYEINTKGEVRNKRRGNILKPDVSAAGYHRVTLGQNHRYRVNRLVAQTFIPNPMGLPVVNHKNGVRGDNRVENLEWCTHSYNCKDAYNRSRDKWGNTGNRGDRNPLSRLCRQINRHTGDVVAVFPGASEAGRATGVNTSTIIEVCNHNRKTAGGYVWEYQNTTFVGSGNLRSTC